MSILQFLGITPAIAGSGTVGIGAHDVPYVDLLPDTAPALDVLLERLLPEPPDNRSGLRLIALITPQGSDAIAESAARKGVAVIEAYPGDPAVELLGRFGSTWERMDTMRTSAPVAPAHSSSEASKVLSQPPPWMNDTALKKRPEHLQKTWPTEDG